jgi:hypothetical protein
MSEINNPSDDIAPPTKDDVKAAPVTDNNDRVKK